MTCSTACVNTVGAEQKRERQVSKLEPYEITISAEIDAEGRLLIRGGDSMPGMFLASADHDAVWRDLGPALKYLLLRNHEWPTPEEH